MEKDKNKLNHIFKELLDINKKMNINCAYEIYVNIRDRDDFNDLSYCEISELTKRLYEEIKPKYKRKRRTNTDAVKRK